MGSNSQASTHVNGGFNFSSLGQGSCPSLFIPPRLSQDVEGALYMVRLAAI